VQARAGHPGQVVQVQRERHPQYLKRLIGPARPACGSASSPPSSRPWPGERRRLQGEDIRRFRILDADFAVGAELTPTQNIRRPYVLGKYTAEIDALYA
jgi:hypothetical protein